MRIPNYDSNTTDNKRISLNNFLHEEYRILVCGNSGCGKTSTIMYMIRKPLDHYDKIYLYTQNQQQYKIKDLQKILDDISKKMVIQY